MVLLVETDARHLAAELPERSIAAMGSVTTDYYSTGGYCFTDFVKVGVPMNIIGGLTAIILIPLFWPLT